MSNAQQSPIVPSDLFKLQYFVSAALSPSGKQIAYVISHIDDEADKEFSTIWLTNVDTGETRQLTSGTATDFSPKWSPDGKQIAFMSTRNEKPQLYVIPVDGGEALQLTKLKQGVGSGPQWSPDGKHIAFTAVAIEEARDFSKPDRVTRTVYRFNAMEYLDDVVQSIYVVPTTGGDVRRVTQDNCLNVSPHWSPDGKKLLYLASMLPESTKPFHAKLRAINLIDNQIQEITGNWGSIYEASWLPDGSAIAFIGQPWGLPIGSKSDLWVIPAAGGTPVCRTSNLKYGIGGGLEPDMPAFGITDTIPISADGRTAYVGVQIGGTVQIYSVALAGDEAHTPLIEGDRTCMLMSGGRRTSALYRQHYV